MKAKLFVITLVLLVLPSVVLAAQNCTKEGGKDYYTAGVSIAGTDSYPDECIGDKRLTEYYCGDNGELEYDYYDCPDSCADGACAGGPAGNVTNLTCVEDWACTDWSACVNDIQTRSCVDSNECNTTLEKPLETQYCTPTPPVTPPPTPATGFAKYRYYILGGIVVLLIILYFAFRKKEEPGIQMHDVPIEKKEG